MKTFLAWVGGLVIAGYITSAMNLASFTLIYSVKDNYTCEKSGPLNTAKKED